MSSLAQLSPQTKALMRDPVFPDVERDDVIALFNGDLSDARGHLQGLFTHLANHQDIDADLWRDLRDFAHRAMQELEDLLCVNCLRHGRVTVGRGYGFDQKACDDCQRVERAL
jgi:hypothetical protein